MRQLELQKTLLRSCTEAHNHISNLVRLSRLRAEEESTAHHRETAQHLCAAVQNRHNQDYDPSNSRPRSRSPTETVNEGPSGEDKPAYLSFIGSSQGETCFAADDRSSETPSPVGGKLLLFSGTLARNKAKFMVDTGATGNFISQSTVRALGLRPYHADSPTKVIIADGTKYTCDRNVSVRVTLGIYATKLVLAVLPMELGVEVILGTPWLASLEGGKPRMDFVDMSIEFVHKGQDVKLTSATANMVAPGVTLKQLRQQVQCTFPLITAAQAQKDLSTIMKINGKREAANEELIEIHTLEPQAPDLGIPDDAPWARPGTTGRTQCPTAGSPNPAAVL